MYTVEEYAAALAKVTEQKDALVADVKRRVLRDRGVAASDIEDALSAVTGETETEIDASITALGDTLPVLIRVNQLTKPVGVDPNPRNPRRPVATGHSSEDLKDQARKRLGRLADEGKLSGAYSLDKN